MTENETKRLETGIYWTGMTKRLENKSEHPKNEKQTINTFFASVFWNETTEKWNVLIFREIF